MAATITPTAPNMHLDNNAYGTSCASSNAAGNGVRLRAIESESEYFLKLLNVAMLRWLILIQAIATGSIFVSQVLMYASASDLYKPVYYTAIGIWGPLLFFSVACGLTWLATNKPSGCIIGTAMGFQITTIFLGLALLVITIISLAMHGRFSYSYSEYSGKSSSSSSYDPEVPGRVFCSFIILSAASVIITAIFSSVQFCRVVCCGGQRAMESVMFEVEAPK